MKLVLFLLPKAEEDIDEHGSFIAETSIEKALAFDKAVFEKVPDLLSPIRQLSRDRSRAAFGARYTTYYFRDRRGIDDRR